MRVDHVIKVKGLAGAERHLLELLPGLRARGVDARLVLLFEPGRPARDVLSAARDAGVPVSTTTILADFDPTLVWRLARRFRRERPVIVHTHLIHADFHATAAARLAGVPAVVTTRHNQDPFRRRFPLRAILRSQMRSVDRIIAVSQAVARFTAEVERAPAEKLVVIPHGIDLRGRRTERRAVRAELGYAAEDLLIGMVGRLIAQKGFGHGLDAFAHLASRDPRARLVIAGDGPLRARLAGRIGQLGLDGRARMLGWHPDAAQLMPALDILLVPSLHEGFGLVLLEAMAQGVPVVACASGAIPEIVDDGRTGLLAPTGDTGRIAELLARLGADEVLRRKLGTAGRRRLESVFSPERMVNATCACYRALAQSQ